MHSAHRSSAAHILRMNKLFNRIPHIALLLVITSVFPCFYGIISFWANRTANLSSLIAPMEQSILIVIIGLSFATLGIVSLLLFNNYLTKREPLILQPGQIAIIPCGKDNQEFLLLHDGIFSLPGYDHPTILDVEQHDHFTYYVRHIDGLFQLAQIDIEYQIDTPRVTKKGLDFLLNQPGARLMFCKDLLEAHIAEPQTKIIHFFDYGLDIAFLGESVIGQRIAIPPSDNSLAIFDMHDFIKRQTIGRYFYRSDIKWRSTKPISLTQFRNLS